MNAKRIIATGLLALMIANFTACDKLNINGITGIKDPNSTNASEESKTYQNGLVWNRLKERCGYHGSKFPYSNADLGGLPVPRIFLKELGIIGSGNNTNWTYLDPQKTKGVALKSRVFVDGTNIYVLVNYQNDRLYIDAVEENDNVYISTWLLKYNVNKEDYELFTKLQGDWRSRIFIQLMDEVYEPQIIHESHVTQSVLNQVSYLRGEYTNTFPNIFVANVDQATATITVGAIYEDGIHYFAIHIQDTASWRTYLNEGYNENQLYEMIKLESVNTTAGSCLSLFDIGYRTASLGIEDIKSGLDNTDKIAKLTQVDVNITTTKDSVNEMNING